MKTITLYVIRRSNEYYSNRGFWPPNIYPGEHFKTEEEAQKVLDKMDPWESEFAVIEPVEIKL
jgi:hypothetical protein